MLNKMIIIFIRVFNSCYLVLQNESAQRLIHFILEKMKQQQYFSIFDSEGRTLSKLFSQEFEIPTNERPVFNSLQVSLL